MANKLKKENKENKEIAAVSEDKSLQEKKHSRLPADPVRTEAQKEKRSNQMRAARRRNRQFLGFFLSVLIVIGAVSIVQRGISFFEEIMDNTTERDEYKQRIEVMVWYDFLPFQDITQVDQNAIKQVSIWSVYNQKDKDGTNVTNEEDEILITEIEINRHAAALFGPKFRYASHMSFTEPVMGLTYIHDETRAAYAIPITSMDVFYYPRIMAIKREDGGRRRVTVGYLPTRNEDGSNIRFPEEGEPSKYMDFIFQRDGNNFYLVALEVNTQIEVKASSSSQSNVLQSSSVLNNGDDE